VAHIGLRHVGLIAGRHGDSLATWTWQITWVVRHVGSLARETLRLTGKKEKETWCLTLTW
jgi:predicted TIM-barrel enzyme